MSSLLAFLVSAILSFTALQSPFLSGGTGTLNQLDQWKSDGVNITQAVTNKPIKFSGLTPGGCVQLTAGNVATTTGTACGSGTGGSAYEIATTSDIAVSGLSYFTKTSGLTTIGSTPTTTVTASSPLSLSNPVVKVGGTNSVLTWDFSFPNTWTGLQVFSSLFATHASTTHATTSSLYVTGLTSALSLFDSDSQATEYTGSSCTNQFVRSLNGAGVATCASVSLTADVTGTLGITNGGTGTSTNGVWGDVLVWNGTNWQGRATSTLGISGGGGTPGGSDTQVQFNDASAFGGDSAFVFDKTLSKLTITNASTSQLTATSATTTNLYVAGLTSALSLFDANGQATEYAGTSCTNQFLRSLNGTGVATCADVTLGTDTTGNFVATVTGTANQISVSGSGSETAAVTLSLPSHVIFPGNFRVANATTTNATTTSLYVTGLTSALSLFDANGQATEYAGTSCTNQFPRSLSAVGAATCASVALATDVSGDLAFSNLTQGSALSVLGVSTNGIADVASIAAGSDHQVLRRSGTSLAFGSINLAQSAAVTGTLPIGNGGTGLTAVGASSTVLTTNGTIFIWQSIVTYVESIINAASLVLTGNWDFGGATGLEIPNGTNPTTNATGECAWDTTSGQFRCFDGSANRVLSNGNFYPAFSFPSGTQTSTTTTSTTTLALGTAFVAETWSQVECWSGAGTVGYRFTDGTNNMNFLQATGTVSRFSLSSNNTFTASEKRFVEVGPMTSSYISCTVSKSYTAD